MNIESNLKHFDDNYEGSFLYQQNNNIMKQKSLQDETKVCRFCGKTSPEVTFRKIAHALPELIGNKTIFSEYECDSCNEHFSRMLEDSFAKYFGVTRSIMKTRGKKGVPSYKTNDKCTRIDVVDDMIKISGTIDREIVNIDEKTNTIDLNTMREPYVPIAVYKTFVKIAITLMPYENSLLFADEKNWLLEKEHTIPDYILPYTKCRFSFIPGPDPNNGFTAIGIKRKNDLFNVPFYQFILSFSNVVFQMCIPCINQDMILRGKLKKYEMPFFPTPFDIQNRSFGKIQNEIADFGDASIRKNESLNIQMKFDEKILADVVNNEIVSN